MIGGGSLYSKFKKNDMSGVKQNEDKYSRFDYGKVRVDFSSGLVGEKEKIKEIR
jgi:hypothetical protein